jgi:hypothetical protein
VLDTSCAVILLKRHWNVSSLCRRLRGEDKGERSTKRTAEVHLTPRSKNGSSFSFTRAVHTGDTINTPWSNFAFRKTLQDENTNSARSVSRIAKQDHCDNEYFGIQIARNKLYKRKIRMNLIKEQR